MDATSPTTTHDLDAFVGTAKASGIPDDALVPLLRQNGWSERRIYRSLTAYYGEALGVAPPSRSGAADNARDGFYYLLNFITLGFWTVALGQIFYTLISRAFPDAGAGIRYEGYLVSQISWQIATIIVTFPVFAYINGAINRELASRSDAADSGVRRWLTYIALVIAAVIVLGDGIWFLETFLRGELTVRFILDSLVLLVIGGGVFAYYLTTIRSDRFAVR
jgi:Domain of unknown function (DUF5671)